MIQVTFIIHYYVPRLRPPEAEGRSDSQLATNCRVMSPLMAIIPDDVITPLSSLVSFSFTAAVTCRLLHVLLLI